MCPFSPHPNCNLTSAATFGAPAVSCPPTPSVVRGPSPASAARHLMNQVVPMKVGVAREAAPGERRVALVPEALGKLTAAGLEIFVEAGAGSGAQIPDEQFVEAGAKVVPTTELYAQSDVILRVQKPTESEAKILRKGQVVIGLLSPLLDP